MTTDRHEQARAHAEARTQTWTDPHSEYADGYVSGHMAGVEWADANPKPRTITRKELNTAMLRAPRGSGAAGVLAQLGIEVRGSDDRVHAGGS